MATWRAGRKKKGGAGARIAKRAAPSGLPLSAAALVLDPSHLPARPRFPFGACGIERRADSDVCDDERAEERQDDESQEQGR